MWSVFHQQELNNLLYGDILLLMMSLLMSLHSQQIIFLVVKNIIIQFIIFWIRKYRSAVSIFHDKACSNRWCERPELFRLRLLLSKPSTYRTVSFCNQDSGLEESCFIDIGISQVQ